MSQLGEKIGKIGRRALPWSKPRDEASAPDSKKPSKVPATPASGTNIKPPKGGPEEAFMNEMAKYTSKPSSSADANRAVLSTSAGSKSTEDHKSSVSRSKHSSIATNATSDQDIPFREAVPPAPTAENSTTNIDNANGNGCTANQRKPMAGGDSTTVQSLFPASTFGQWWAVALREGNKAVADQVSKAMIDQAAFYSSGDNVFSCQRAMCTISRQLSLFKCSACQSPMNVTAQQVVDDTTSELAKDRPVQSGFTCHRCLHRSCIGCGKDVNKLRATKDDSNRSALWCCEVGRMFLLWSLCCGTGPDKKGTEGEKDTHSPSPPNELQQPSKSVMTHLFKKFKKQKLDFGGSAKATSSKVDDDPLISFDPHPFEVVEEVSVQTTKWTLTGKKKETHVLPVGSYFDKNVSLAQKLSQSFATGESAVPDGIGYGGQRWGWQQSSNLTDVAAATKAKDHLLRQYFRALTELLSEVGNSASVDSWAMSCHLRRQILSRSPLLEVASDLLRTSSVEDMTRRFKLYDQLFKFLAAIAERPTLIAVMHASGVVLPASDKLPEATFLAPEEAAQILSKDDRLQPQPEHEKRDSLVGLLNSLAETCSFFMEMAKRQPADIFEDGQRSQSICEQVAKLHEQLCQNGPSNSKTATAEAGPSAPKPSRMMTRSATARKKEAAAASAWHEDNRLGIMDDTLVFQSLCFNLEDECMQRLSSTKTRIKRLINDINIMRTCLPEGIFVRHQESRLDIFKVLIAGPKDTPYEGGLFEFDMICPPKYPQVPPNMRLKTTGEGRVRFNPNLYADGTVCLSLLGTWGNGQTWDPAHSSLLQVLVSIQAMIFCEEPYYNEPGRESHPEPTASRKENEILHSNTVKHAMLYWLNSLPSSSYPNSLVTDTMPANVQIWQSVVRKHFKLNGPEIANMIKKWPGKTAHAELMAALRRHSFV